MSWFWDEHAGWNETPTPSETPVREVRSTAPTAAEVLSAGGILRAAEVVAIANSVGLDLAAAATLLIKESGGGRNVWGHDAVPTAGTYVPGSEVTPQAYAAYKAAVHAGRAGRQGCGPTQLTWGGYQDMADALNGCFDWASNCRVGFTVLAKAIKDHGLRDGFRAFNGSGPAAERYADDAMTKYAAWKQRLAGAAPSGGDEELTPDEHATLDQIHGYLSAIYQQLSGSTTLGQWPGWPAWAGGTSETLTMLDYLRRCNVEVRQCWQAVQQLQKDIAALKAKWG